MPPSIRFTYLDLTRGIAALAVLLFHYTSFFLGAGEVVSTVKVTSQPWRSVLWPLYDYGGYAVQLFWLLSGIVFMSVYREQRIRGREFLLRRFARLYPLHFITLIAMLGMELASRYFLSTSLQPRNDAFHFMLNIFLIPNWGLKNASSFNFPIWSVATELVAYVVFFAAIAWKFTSFLWLAGIAVVSTALALITAQYIPTCVALFFIGTLIARVPQAAGKWHTPLAITGLIASIIITVAISHSPLSRHIGLVLCYGIFPFLLLAIFAIDINFRPVPKSFHWIGNSTYAVYLTHIPVLTAFTLTANILQFPLPAEKVWFLFLYIVTVLAVSVLAFSYFERPAQSAILGWGGSASQMLNPKANNPTSLQHLAQVEAIGPTGDIRQVHLASVGGLGEKKFSKCRIPGDRRGA